MQAALSLGGMTQPGSASLAAAEALHGSSTEPAPSSALFACAAGPSAAALHGLIPASLLGIVTAGDARPAAGSPSTGAGDFTYSAEMQAAEPAVGAAAVSGAPRLHVSGKLGRVLKLHSSSLVGCMAQAVGALQHAAAGGSGGAGSAQQVNTAWHGKAGLSVVLAMGSLESPCCLAYH